MSDAIIIACIVAFPPTVLGVFQIYMQNMLRKDAKELDKRMTGLSEHVDGQMTRYVEEVKQTAGFNARKELMQEQAVTAKTLADMEHVAKLDADKLTAAALIKATEIIEAARVVELALIQAAGVVESARISGIKTESQHE